MKFGMVTDIIYIFVRINCSFKNKKLKKTKKKETHNVSKNTTVLSLYIGDRQKLRYISNGFTDLREIWHNDAELVLNHPKSESPKVQTVKNSILKIQDGG